MKCYDFTFDKEKLSDYGMMICSFDGNGVAWSGGDITFNTVQSPSSDKQTFYSSKYETPISCNLSVCKSTCENGLSLDISQTEYSAISRWLKRRDGFHLLHFDEEDFEDIYFNCKIDMQPYQEEGKTIGFNLVITTDAPCGYSDLKVKNFTLDDTAPYTFLNNSDDVGTIYPKVTIKTIGETGQSGSVKLCSGLTSGTKTVSTIINNVTNGSVITLDGENDLFTGIDNINNFNTKFPIIYNTYNERQTSFSKLEGSVSMDVKLEYREVRMVTI